MGSQESSDSLASRLQHLLSRLQAGANLQLLLSEMVDVVSEHTRCESVGIRWKASDDYPYLVTRGFGRDFVVREGPLCSRDAAGIILRHPDGTPRLACMCGAVVQGRTDRALPFFTEGGSFYTNGTTELLATAPPSALSDIPTRNYCNHAGYESVALVPLRVGDEVCGLLQLNSRTPGRFTPQSIAMYEKLARDIATALASRRAGEGPLSTC